MLEIRKKCSIHQRNSEVLMSGIYKINNGLALSLMNFPFLFRNNKYNSRNFRVFSTDLRKMVNYGLETVAYSAPTIWIKLPSECKLASSLD